MLDADLVIDVITIVSLLAGIVGCLVAGFKRTLAFTILRLPLAELLAITQCYQNGILDVWSVAISVLASVLIVTGYNARGDDGWFAPIFCPIGVLVMSYIVLMFGPDGFDVHGLADNLVPVAVVCVAGFVFTFAVLRIAAYVSELAMSLRSLEHEENSPAYYGPVRDRMRPPRKRPLIMRILILRRRRGGKPE